MNLLRRTMSKILQKIVDKVHGKPIDIVVGIGYSIITLFSVFAFLQIIGIFKTPIITHPINTRLYSFLILLPILLFFISMSGKYFNEPSRRLIQFVFCVLTTSLFGIGHTMQITNLSLLSAISKIRNIDKIPFSLIEGNIRLMTLSIPVLIITPVTYITIKLIFEEEIKKDLIAYEVDAFLPTIHKMDETTIDLKICKDFETGDYCIVPEKILNEHVLLQGGTGSGKSATYVKPILGQLFNIKAKLREAQKKLAYEALKEGIADITQPITNYWFNKNFTMDYIKPKEGKKDEFIKKFEKHIIGIRDKERLILKKDTQGEVLELKQLKGDKKYLIEVAILRNGMEIIEKEIEVNSSDDALNIEVHKDHKPITITSKIETELGKLADKEDTEENIKEMKEKIEEFTLLSENDEENQGKLYVNLPLISNPFSYKIKINEKDSGKIIYKGLGATVIAPDGELAKDTIKIASNFGVKVHKFDPSKDEIAKGGIAKFNPLAGDHPEKVGDIISSILVSMEHGENAGGKTNPYFTNASVRAIRNITILLKIMYPKLKERDPNLDDILKILNNFKIAEEVCEEMKKIEELRNKYSNVIDYFESSFYAPEVDNNGRIILGRRRGSQRKKTEEAISGIINQLDNFLGREEIKYILCPENDEESLKLSDVLENGECIAISTRQSELGQRLGKAFALFFILSMQNDVLSRFSENENPEVPHYLIIDEFPFYINDMTKIFFTFARKYKTSITVAIQNMSQLEEISEQFRRTIFTNTSTKMLLPKSTPEDREYWSKYFGTYKKFEMQTGVTQTGLMADNPNYSEQRRGTIVDKPLIPEQDINDLHFQQAFYVYTDHKARERRGKGTTDFLHIAEKDKVKLTDFDFERFVALEKTSDSIKIAEKLLQEERESSSKLINSEDEQIKDEFKDNSKNQEESEEINNTPKEKDENIDIEVEEKTENIKDSSVSKEDFDIEIDSPVNRIIKDDNEFEVIIGEGNLENEDSFSEEENFEIELKNLTPKKRLVESETNDDIDIKVELEEHSDEIAITKEDTCTNTKEIENKKGNREFKDEIEIDIEVQEEI